MRLITKPGVALATILAASIGFMSLSQAAPLAGVAAAVPAVQLTQEPSTLEALLEKVHHKGYVHQKKGKSHHHHHHHYHHHHHQHAM